MYSMAAAAGRTVSGERPRHSALATTSKGRRRLPPPSRLYCMASRSGEKRSETEWRNRDELSSKYRLISPILSSLYDSKFTRRSYCFDAASILASLKPALVGKINRFLLALFILDQNLD